MSTFNTKGRDRLEGLDVDGRIILKWVETSSGRVLTGLIWLRIGTGPTTNKYNPRLF
jgi:hypothetical protein